MKRIVLIIAVIGGTAQAQTQIVPLPSAPAQVPSRAPALSQTLPGQGGAPRCEVKSLSRTAAEEMDEVVLRGAGLDAGCHVEFSDAPPHQPPSKTFPAKVVPVNPTTLKATVPLGVPPGARALRVIWNGKPLTEWTFTIQPSNPVLRSLAPPSVFPGDHVTIWADNLRPAPQDPWQVVIDVASADGSMGTLGSVTPRSVNANWETHKGTIEFVVPDIYLPPTHAAVPVNAGPEFEADHALRLIAAAKRISIVRTGARSNAIPILIKSPHYVLQSLSPAMAHQGDVVTVTGTNYWEPVAGQRYIGYFDLGPRGRVAAAKTEGVSSTTFKLTVPWDLFNGFIQARRAGVLLVREPMGIASNALRVNLVYQRPPPPSDPCPQKVDPPNCNLAGQSNGRATCFANRYWCCGQNAPEDSDLADTAQICDVGFHPYGGICDPGRTPSQGGCLKISAP